MIHIPIAGILTPLAFFRRMAETGHWVGWEYEPGTTDIYLLWPEGSPWLPLYEEAPVHWKLDFTACVEEHTKATRPHTPKEPRSGT